jgi:branched-chain amino acid transport system permease protein
MTLFTGAAFNGLVLSSVYILIALGFALMLSLLGVFNFAHGAVYMVGAYITYEIWIRTGLSQWLSLLSAVVLTALLGLFLERFCFRPFAGRTNSVIVMAIAIIFVLETGVSVLFGGYDFAVRAFIPGGIRTTYFSVTWDKLMTLVVGCVLLIVVVSYIKLTLTGRQMLAIAQDREGALLQGINVNRVSAIATMMACGLAGLAGALMSSLYTMGPFMGDPMLLKAITVIILSGIGSIGGIVVGGLIVGMLDALLPVYISGSAAQTIAFGVVMLILLIRPKGLFGYELF